MFLEADQVETNHPILFIGNLYDNVTPLESAHNNSAHFPGSVVLQQNSLGVSLELDLLGVRADAKCSTAAQRRHRPARRGLSVNTSSMVPFRMKARGATRTIISSRRRATTCC